MFESVEKASHLRLSAARGGCPWGFCLARGRGLCSWAAEPSSEPSVFLSVSLAEAAAPVNAFGFKLPVMFPPCPIPRPPGGSCAPRPGPSPCPRLRLELSAYSHEIRQLKTTWAVFLVTGHPCGAGGFNETCTVTEKSRNVAITEASRTLQDLEPAHSWLCRRLPFS